MMRHVSCILLLEGSTISQRLWVYRIPVPYVQKDPRFLFEKRRGQTNSRRFYCAFLYSGKEGRGLGFRGGSRLGGGALGGQNPPPPFSGTPKLHKEKKKSLRACARIEPILVFNSYGDPSVVNSYGDPPPPFRNPVSAPRIRILVIRGKVPTLCMTIITISVYSAEEVNSF